MSDQPLNIFDFGNLSNRQIIQSLINEAFFADFGIVRQVSSNQRVSVEHVTRPVTMGGIGSAPQVLEATFTNDVELLFFAMGGLAISGQVQVGDLVLLIGLRSLVPSTSGIKESQAPPEFWHYSQQTMKAIPLTGLGNSLLTITEINGLLQIKNQTQSLGTLIQQLISTIKGLTPIGAPTSHVLPPDQILALTNLGISFSQLLEE